MKKNEILKSTIMIVGLVAFGGCGSDSSDIIDGNDSTQNNKSGKTIGKTVDGIYTYKNLSWQDDEEVKTRSTSYQEFRDYCPQLTLGGFDDWRLPTVKECTEIFPEIKDNLNFSYSNDNYIFYTSGEYFKNELGHSIHMYNSSNNATPLFRVYIMKDDPFPWGVRCVRNVKE